MDTSWDLSAWKPSIHSQTSPGGELPEWKSPPPEALPRLQSRLKENAAGVANSPYSPQAWIERASVLLELGYPELAAADYWKSILLLNSAIDENVKLGEDVGADNLTLGMKVLQAVSLALPLSENQVDMSRLLFEGRLNCYHLLITTLTILEAYSDILEVSRQALEFYPDNQLIANYKKELEIYASELLEDDSREPDPKEMAASLRVGGVMMVAYPWLPSEQRVRSHEVIADARKEMLECSRQALEVKRSPIGDNCVGVFAVKDISKGDVILDSQGPVGVNCDQLSGKACYNCYGKLGNSQTTFACCPQLNFCGNKCRDVAGKFYHQAVCGKDFTFLDQVKKIRVNSRDDDRHPFSTLAWLRMLAVCVQDGRHPLDVPIFARLLPQHAIPKTVPWDFEARVAQPNKVLQILGVDIFADQRYDNWVLENLWCRKANNCVNSSLEDSSYENLVDPLYSFFNHSCGEADIMQCPTASSRIVLRAKRDLKKGEEVFTRYIILEEGMASSERKLFLASWLPDGCFCKLCVEENKGTSGEAKLPEVLM